MELYEKNNKFTKTLILLQIKQVLKCCKEEHPIYILNQLIVIYLLYYIPIYCSF